MKTKKTVIHMDAADEAGISHTLTATAEEVELLCLLAAGGAYTSYGRGGHADRMGQLVFKAVWDPDSPIHHGECVVDDVMEQDRRDGPPYVWTDGRDLGTVIVAIAASVARHLQLDHTPSALISAIFSLAVKMYRGELEPATGRQAILYATVLKRMGMVDDEGNWIPEADRR